jgi:hypothetical protein
LGIFGWLDENSAGLRGTERPSNGIFGVVLTKIFVRSVGATKASDSINVDDLKIANPKGFGGQG